MKGKSSTGEKLCRVFGNKRQQIILFTTGSLTINLSYSMYNALLGIMLFLLAFTLTGSICLSLKYDLAKSYDTITMITIATYTFPKIVIAVINLGKAKRHDSPLIIAIRNIGISDALVSMLSMQMSMFATFGKEEAWKSHTMNVITGAGVCFCIVLIGLSMVRNAKKMNKNIS